MFTAIYMGAFLRVCARNRMQARTTATHPHVDLGTNETMRKNQTHVPPDNIYTHKLHLNVNFDVGGLTPNQCNLLSRDQGVHVLGNLCLSEDTRVGSE